MKPASDPPASDATPRSALQANSNGTHKFRAAFTLFELILAIALSAALLALVGAAINLYLLRVDSSRARVEEAQLARSILAMIADDLRATSIYQPQDTSAIAQLMVNGTPFDVDSIDDERTPSSGSGGAQLGAGSASSISSSSSSFGGGSSAFGSSGMSSIGSSSTSSSSSMSSAESDSTMPLGLNGSLNQLYIDVTRLPRREELFGTITGYTNAPLPQTSGFGVSASVTSPGAGVVPPSDLKTIRYFVREGEHVAPAGVGATSLSPALQSRAGGLVRQEISRPLRIFAEESGDNNILESGQSLIAPEVVYVEFRYWDGQQQPTELWDMVEQESLPLAVEVTIWLAADDVPGSSVATYSPTDLTRRARAYRETVFLPMAESSKSGGAGGRASSSASSSSTSSSSGSTSSGFGSSSGSGSGFGNQ